MIRVEGLFKQFTANKERVAAVAGIDFEVGPGEVVTLLGPSGCGKTTTLRCVAGLERAEGGRITIGERTVAISAWCFSPMPSGRT
jgi:ABC-type Fe3+/spermidine/putrescine transport system ATPase subunit